LLAARAHPRPAGDVGIDDAVREGRC